ncbi:MAG: OmpA family protein [Proteobacteria bacterium]|nr:OmpA family protein [Pseudomonadota bacterium]
MQCEGITRSGQRCRRKALEDALFCSVHQRVNQTYSLALLAPFLTVLLLGYFFLYGIFFDTLVYGVFDLNYLKFAGLSDLFVSMFRVGGMLTVIVLKLWFVFTLTVALGFAVALLIKLTILTSKLHLKFGRRIRIIGLSLGIYLLNFICLFVFLLPKVNQSRPGHLLIGREHLVRSLNAEKKRHLPPMPRKVRENTADYFRHFQMVSSFRNHRFFAILFVLAVTSILSLFYAGHQAREARNCVIGAVEEKTSFPTPATLLPGINIAPLCLAGADPDYRNISVTGKFSESLSSFFAFPSIVLTFGTEEVPLVFIGSTNRFELFFSGITRLPFILPNQNLGIMFNPSQDSSARKISDIQKELSALADQAQQTEQSVSDLASQSDQSAREGLIQTLTSKTGRSLKHLDQKLSLLEKNLQQDFKRRQQQNLSTIPIDCWNTAPLAILKFATGRTQVTRTTAQEMIEAYAVKFVESERHHVIVSGYADPSGPTYRNNLISEDRANSVRDLLMASGLDPVHVIAIGHGESTSNSLPRRRVEIRDCTGLL